MAPREKEEQMKRRRKRKQKKERLFFFFSLSLLSTSPPDLPEKARTQVAQKKRWRRVMLRDCHPP